MFIDTSLQALNPNSGLSDLALQALPLEKREEAKKLMSEFCDADYICDVVENNNDYRQTFNLLKGFIPKERYAMIPLAQNGEIKIVDRQGNEISTTKIQ